MPDSDKKRKIEMTEKEKMFSGKLYDPFCEGMPEERIRAHVLCKAYNDTTDLDEEKRTEILNELLPHRGKNVYIQGPVYFDFGTHIFIGDGSFANFNFTVLDEGKVTIGKNVFIGPNVSIFTPIHPLRFQERNAFVNKDTGKLTNLERAGIVNIGDNCWLGGNVTICPNVSIGEGCVIGAGSVVTRNIPPHSLAVGNPCRILRSITEEDSVNLHPEFFN